VRSRVQFLARLPYARLACLFLAAAQLMPLPEEPEDCPSRSLRVVRAGPDPWSQRPPLEGGILMQHDQKQLHQIAQDYLWYMFNIEEIALLCNVSRDVVSKVRATTDSPFCLNKCRPEWFAEWMREHPDFQLTKGSLSESETPPASIENETPRKQLKRRKLSARPQPLLKRQMA
jgi:hypothetical protein